MDGNDFSSTSSKVSSFSVPQTPRSEGEILQSSNLKSFSFAELKMSTRNFRPDSVLGEGGFGMVYKGWINKHTFAAAKPGTGMIIAVKCLSQESFQGHKEWLAEANYLGQLSHPHLVKLIGYCMEYEQRLLVYEFMPRGSLESHKYRRASHPLSWNLRLKVALDAAKALAFLHGAETRVIYVGISKLLIFRLIRATMQSFLILGWPGMGRQVMQLTSLPGFWGPTDMLLQSIQPQVILLPNLMSIALGLSF